LKIEEEDGSTGWLRTLRSANGERLVDCCIEHLFNKPHAPAKGLADPSEDPVARVAMIQDPAWRWVQGMLTKGTPEAHAFAQVRNHSVRAMLLMIANVVNEIGRRTSSTRFTHQTVWAFPGLAECTGATSTGGCYNVDTAGFVTQALCYGAGMSILHCILRSAQLLQDSDKTLVALDIFRFFDSNCTDNTEHWQTVQKPSAMQWVAQRFKSQKATDIQAGDVLAWAYDERSNLSSGHVCIALSKPQVFEDENGRKRVSLLIADSTQESDGVAVRVFDRFFLDEKGCIGSTCETPLGEVSEIRFAAGRIVGGSHPTGDRLPLWHIGHRFIRVAAEGTFQPNDTS